MLNRGNVHTTPDSRKRKKKKRRKVDDVVSNDRAKRKRRDNLLKRLRENSDSLSKDQKRVLTIVGSGHNAFFTGSAGTGKSHLLRHLLKVMDSATTFVTAPTGIAACNVGGITLQYVFYLHRTFSNNSFFKLKTRRQTVPLPASVWVTKTCRNWSIV